MDVRRALKRFRKGDLILVEGMDWSYDERWRDTEEAMRDTPVTIVIPGFYLKHDEKVLVWAPKLVHYGDGSVSVKSECVCIGAIESVTLIKKCTVPGL